MIATLRESKARLSALVARAQSGEDVVITVHGEPRARLTAIRPDSRASRLRWAADLRRLQRKHASKKACQERGFDRPGASRGPGVIYWDTSCVVKLYAPEEDSEELLALATETDDGLCCSAVLTAELFYALRQKELRKEINPGAAALIRFFASAGSLSFSSALRLTRAAGLLGGPPYGNWPSATSRSSRV